MGEQKMYPRRKTVESSSGLILNSEATEAIASVAPGLCLGALSKVPIEIYKFLIEVPFAKEKSPCSFKYEVSGLHLSSYSKWLSNCFYS